MLAPPSPLWRLASFQLDQRVPVGSRYWWDNTSRSAGETAVFQYTRAGSLLFRERGIDRLVPPGHAALFTHREPTAYGLPAGTREPYRCTWLALAGAGIAAHWAELRRQHGSVVACDPATLAEARRLIVLGDPRQGSDALSIAAAAQAFVIHLFASLGRQAEAGRSPVQRAIAGLLAHPCRPWSLKEAADAHGISREHLTRAFTAQVGSPPAAWLAKARLDRALALLAGSGLPVAAVAEQSGFASTHTLARQVRLATGRSPRAWREAALNPARR
jgi:AraC-like DNA-binding protein